MNLLLSSDPSVYDEIMQPVLHSGYLYKSGSANKGTLSRKTREGRRLDCHPPSSSALGTGWIDWNEPPHRHWYKGLYWTKWTENTVWDRQMLTVGCCTGHFMVEFYWHVCLSFILLVNCYILEKGILISNFLCFCRLLFSYIKEKSSRVWYQLPRVFNSWTESVSASLLFAQTSRSSGAQWRGLYCSMNRTGVRSPVWRSTSKTSCVWVSADLLPATTTLAS